MIALPMADCLRIRPPDFRASPGLARPPILFFGLHDEDDAVHQRARTVASL
jgi:hypothetical protein